MGQWELGRDLSASVRFNIPSRGKSRALFEWHFLYGTAIYFHSSYFRQTKTLYFPFPKRSDFIIAAEKKKRSHFFFKELLLNTLLGFEVLNNIALSVCELQMRRSSCKHFLCPLLCLSPLQGSAFPSPAALSLSLLFVLCSVQQMMCRWRFDPNPNPHEEIKSKKLACYSFSLLTGNL